MALKVTSNESAHKTNQLQRVKPQTAKDAMEPEKNSLTKKREKSRELQPEKPEKLRSKHKEKKRKL